MRIKQAIKRFNDNRKPNTPKLTQKSLGALIMPKEEEAMVTNYLSRWGNGYYKYLKVWHVQRICKHLKCDANFLLGDVDLETYDYEQLEVSNILAMVKNSNKTMNTFFKTKPKK